MYVDSHAHMSHRRFDSARKDILHEVKASGINIVVNPAIGFESNFSMFETLKNYDWIYCAVGIHPNSVTVDGSRDEEWEAGLKQLMTRHEKKIVAIGETGLDFHRLSRSDDGTLDEVGETILNRQYKWFRKQLEMASEIKCPVICHIRNANEKLLRDENNIGIEKSLDYVDAHKEAIKILEEFSEKISLEVKGVIHCFTSDDYEVAKRYMEMGYVIGVGGEITRTANESLRQCIQKIPLERIVLETDSPFLKPEGSRTSGKNNTPINIPYIAKVLADLKKIDVSKVEKITTANAKLLFGI